MLRLFQSGSNHAKMSADEVVRCTCRPRHCRFEGMNGIGKRRGLKVIAESPEYGTRILYHPDAQHVCWITREDLFDWMWTMPETKVSAALAVHASWLCNIYRINRPSMGHWYRLRKGLDAPREPLAPSLPPDTPIPLVHFEYVDGGSYAVVSDMLPWMRVGGPDRTGPIYPEDAGETPAFLGAASGHPARFWSRDPVGPPCVPTVREFRDLIWKTEPRHADPIFALLGLSKREVAKIARRSGLAVPTSAWWSNSSYWSQHPTPDRTRTRSLTRLQLRQPIDLSHNTLQEVREEVAADLAAEEATRIRRSEASRAAVARAGARLDAGFPSIIESLVQGHSGKDACVAAGVAQLTFRAELRRRLRAALGQETGGSNEADIITGRVMRGSADRYESLLAHHALEHDRVDPTRRSDRNDRYSNEVPVTSIPSLVRWIVATEAVAQAEAEMKRQDHAIAHLDEGFAEPSMP